MLRGGALALGVGLYGWQLEPRWVEYVRLPMTFTDVRTDLIGKTVVQFSDLHIGDRFDYGYIELAFARVRKLAPDYVVYTGDYVSYDRPYQLEQLRNVMRGAPLGQLGTYAVLGNHDYGKAWRESHVADAVANVLSDASIRVLRNERVFTDEGLAIYGLDDLWGTRFDPSPTLSLQRNDEPAIALCHNPDVCDLDVWGGWRGWVLSGHTHGGQVKPPFLPPPVLPVQNERYSAGHIALGEGRDLYVNRALGHLWPVRFNVRPEVTIFDIREA